MGKSRPHKYRKRVHPQNQKSARSQRLRWEKKRIQDNIDFSKTLENTESSKEIPQNNEGLESTNDSPITSDVHEGDYFEEGELPLSVQLIEGNEIPLGVDAINIKTEVCEEDDNLHEEMDGSKYVTEALPFCEENNLHGIIDPETLPQLHQNDHNIPYSSGYLLEEKTEMSYNKENKLLLNVIKYLDENAKVDKFDLGGKLYAAKLRSVTFKIQQSMAENLCRQVLVEAEHFNLDDKIVLSKDQSSNNLTNYIATNVSDKDVFEESDFLHLEKEALLQNIENRLAKNNKENQCDNFAKLYAAKMRSFSSIQYYYADKLINEIILEAELGRLRASCKLIKYGNPPPQTFVSGKSYAREYRTSVLPASNVPCANNQTQLKQSDKNATSTTSAQNKTPNSKNMKGTKQLTNDPVNKGLIYPQPIKKGTSVQNNVQKISVSPVQKNLGQSVSDQLRNKSGAEKNSSIKTLVFPSASVPSTVSDPNNVHQLPANKLIKVVFLNKGHQTRRYDTPTFYR